PPLICARSRPKRAATLSMPGPLGAAACACGGPGGCAVEGLGVPEGAAFALGGGPAGTGGTGTSFGGRRTELPPNHCAPAPAQSSASQSAVAETNPAALQILAPAIPMRRLSNAIAANSSRAWVLWFGHRVL